MAGKMAKGAPTGGAKSGRVGRRSLLRGSLARPGLATGNEGFWWPALTVCSRQAAT